MAKTKITVLRRMFNQDFAEQYCQPGTQLCTAFEDGQEFILDGIKQPENFCSWAWNDIHKCLLTLVHRGDFQPWMKEENNIIACCTDGIRPVIFNLERIDD